MTNPHSAAAAAWYCALVGRLFLAIWLALFVVQGTELLASVVPDDCVEETRGPAPDPCQRNCAQCVCCARLPVFVPQVLASASIGAALAVDSPPTIDHTTSAHPRGVLHVPKPSSRHV